MPSAMSRRRVKELHYRYSVRCGAQSPNPAIESYPWIAWLETPSRSVETLR